MLLVLNWQIWHISETLPLVNEGGGGGMSCGKLCFGHLVTLFETVAESPLFETWTASTPVPGGGGGNFQLVSFILTLALAYPFS